MAKKWNGRNAAKKSYSFDEKVKYHQKRLEDPKVSDNKKCYSRNWLDGFQDRFARNNYSAVCTEIKYKEGRVPKEYLIPLYGYKNGIKANLEIITTSKLVVCTTPKRGKYLPTHKWALKFGIASLSRAAASSGCLFCLLILATRERVYVLFHAYLLVHIIFFKLVSYVLLYYAFILPYRIHIISSAPKTSPAVFIF